MYFLKNLKSMDEILTKEEIETLEKKEAEFQAMKKKC